MDRLDCMPEDGAESMSFKATLLSLLRNIKTCCGIGAVEEIQPCSSTQQTCPEAWLGDKYDWGEDPHPGQRLSMREDYISEPQLTYYTASKSDGSRRSKASATAHLTSRDEEREHVEASTLGSQFPGLSARLPRINSADSNSDGQSYNSATVLLVSREGNQEQQRWDVETTQESVISVP
ncbi:hypothetical protein EIK77_005446 [Talaromyces pinophilus]|nr:hypothetical protein EIK77_005446 [Talaromyces pinophilus]